MASKKREKKKYVPRDSTKCLFKTQPWRLNAVFDPLLAIVHQLERDGTVDVSANGTPMFKDVVDGYWYDSAYAIMGVVDAYEIHEKRAGVTIDLSPLRLIATKLQNDQGITDMDVQQARSCFERMRKAAMSMTLGYAAELIRDTQIQEAADKLRHAT
ncbi:hypothetical protein [Undibacterium sp. TJN19]|uniref:hypothetical protein n=1 Tax=Undibacterium sp. TJN19 TaxID=3413055 RepID=UPI003BF3422A